MSTEQVTDVVIVGGGVAGASLGAALAQAGLGVIIVEREARFRDRVRGEGIHAWGVAEADRLGLLDVLRSAGATELPRFRNYQDREMSSEPASIPEISGLGFGEWSVYHPAMQDALIAHASTCGATVLRPAKVSSVRVGRSPEVVVSTDGDERVIRTRLVVGADGRLSGVRHSIGARMESDPTDHHHIGGVLISGHRLAGDSVYTGSREDLSTFTIPRADGTVRTYLITLPDRLAPFRSRDRVMEFIRTCESILPEESFADSEPVGAQPK